MTADGLVLEFKSVPVVDHGILVRRGAGDSWYLSLGLSGPLRRAGVDRPGHMTTLHDPDGSHKDQLDAVAEEFAAFLRSEYGTGRRRIQLRFGPLGSTNATRNLRFLEPDQKIAKWLTARIQSATSPGPLFLPGVHPPYHFAEYAALHVRVRSSSPWAPDWLVAGAA